MEQVIFEAHRRTPAGKGGARQARRDGLVPGVVYGHGLDPIPLAVEARTLSEHLRRHHGGNVLFDLRVDGEAPEGLAAIIREVQADPTTDELLSVDFRWVSLSEQVQVHVAVITQGLAAGVKAGGMLEVVLHQVLVSCLPTDIPEQIVVDVTDLEMGQSLHVSDLAAPEGVTVLTPADDAVLSVRTPHVVVEEVVPAEGEAEEEAAEEGEAETEAKAKE